MPKQRQKYRLIRSSLGGRPTSSTKAEIKALQKHVGGKIRKIKKPFYA